jgi:hypothetical protein
MFIKNTVKDSYKETIGMGISQLAIDINSLENYWSDMGEDPNEILSELIWIEKFYHFAS